MSPIASLRIWAFAAVALSVFYQVEAIAQSMLIDESIDETALPAWLAYGGAELISHDRPGPYQYTFDEEHEARATLVQVWSELRKDSNGPDIEYLSQL